MKVGGNAVYCNRSCDIGSQLRSHEGEAYVFVCFLVDRHVGETYVFADCTGAGDCRLVQLEKRFLIVWPVIGPLWSRRLGAKALRVEKIVDCLLHLLRGRF